jgi:hypothetical protein
MTDNATENHEAKRPLVLAPNDVLGGMVPARFVWRDVTAMTDYICASPAPWPGKRKVSLCATVPWRKGKSGKRARKDAFAARARKCRKWTAQYKIESIACGAYYLPPNAAVTGQTREKKGQTPEQDT